jgi:hypothetical protein
MTTAELTVPSHAAMEMGAPLANKLMQVPEPAYSEPIKARDFTLSEIEMLEARLLHAPQVEIPLTHLFAPHVYWREVFMPKGSFVIGHQHKTEHFNVVLTGRARVLMAGEMHEIVAPCVMTSGAGVRKILYIEEDMRWATIHPTDETDMERLEEELIIKSDSFLAKELEQMQQLLKSEGERT